MIKRGKAAGIMIDMQEKLVPAVAHPEQLVSDCRAFLKGLDILKVPFIASQQYTKGLGMTIPELSELTGGSYVEKITFSCWREEAFRTAVRKLGVEQVMICGTETHICVQQTVLDMLEAGFEVYLIADCVGSRFDRDREAGIRRMEQAGAVITTFESALFELTERGGTAEFKEISRLVKTR